MSFKIVYIIMRYDYSLKINSINFKSETIAIYPTTNCFNDSVIAIVKTSLSKISMFSTET